MTEHKTEEFQRQYQQAFSDYKEAEKRMRAASDLLIKAKEADLLAEYASQGIVPGTIVNAIKNEWRGEKITRCTFLGVSTAYSTPSAQLASLKKDGSAGKAKRYIPFDRLEVSS